MNDVMIDLETLGTRPGSTILSIGAVGFSAESAVLHTAPFYSVISRQSCRHAGLSEDRDTVAWWAKQTPDAQKVLTEAGDADAPVLFRVLWNFDRWLSQFGFSRVRIWGNGANFDNVLLRGAYEAVGMTAPWLYWNDRCHRTLKELCPTITINRGQGTHHNALDDATAQAEQAIKCLRLLAGWTPPGAP